METRISRSPGFTSTNGPVLTDPVANPAVRQEHRDFGVSHGHVTVNEHIPTARFNRFVDERMKEWILDHDLETSDCEYEVAFFDEDALGEVSCLIVVQSGPNLWRAWESADDAKAALRMSLGALKVEDSVVVGLAELPSSRSSDRAH